MAEKIIGLKILIEANIGTEESPDYQIVAGQRDGAINIAADAIDTSSKDGDGWKTSAIGLLGWDADLDGVIIDTNAGLSAIETAFKAGTKILVRMVFPDGSKRRGSAFVTSLPLKAPMAGEATYSVKLQGDGELLTDTSVITAPTITAPEDEETDVGVEDPITTGAFAITGGGSDSHAATQWQVTETADTNFATPVIDTISTVELLSYTPAAGTLEAETGYKVRARHRGVAFGWSAWSEVNDFTTAV